MMVHWQFETGGRGDGETRRKQKKWPSGWLTCSEKKMSMLNCNAISTARKKHAIRRSLRLLGDCICLYSPRMACVTQLSPNVKSPTCLLASGIMCDWRPLDVCWQKTPKRS